MIAKMMISVTIAAGGHSMSLGLCPTKLPMTWDTRVGHSGVPAT